MNLRQLRYFQSVVRTGSQTVASTEMGVSQPALGVQVRALETELGTALFHRKSRGMELTEAGKEFSPQVDDILARLDMAKESVQRFANTQKSDIRLGMPPTPGKALLPSFLTEWGRRDRAKLIVHEGLSFDLLSRVRDGALDYAFCYDPPRDALLETLPLFHEELVLIGPPDKMRGKEPALSFCDLARLPLILDSKNQITRVLLESMAEAEGIALNVVLEVEAVNLKRELMESLRAFSIVPFGLFSDDIANGRFAIRPIVSPRITRTLCLVNRCNGRHGAHKELVTILLKILSDKIGTQLNWHTGDPA
ncbi:LysR family transcriptional regulator [Cognatishimia sp. D5M38]|uniref:LysR family transcriptional regulator n=1 Tax=Cognatishimia coralii TaxID=3083254 RepID=A0ABU8QKT0_9RHOB